MRRLEATHPARPGPVVLWLKDAESPEARLAEVVGRVPGLPQAGWTYTVYPTAGPLVLWQGRVECATCDRAYTVHWHPGVTEVVCRGCGAVLAIAETPAR